MLSRDVSRCAVIRSSHPPKSMFLGLHQLVSFPAATIAREITLSNNRAEQDWDSPHLLRRPRARGARRKWGQSPALSQPPAPCPLTPHFSTYRSIIAAPTMSP